MGVYEEQIVPIKISQLAEYVSKRKRIALEDALMYPRSSHPLRCLQQEPGRHSQGRIHVNDFSIEQENLPAKSFENVADYSGVKTITLAFYTSDGTEQYQVSQMRDDTTIYTTFGNFECDLPMGSYTMGPPTARLQRPRRLSRRQCRGPHHQLDGQ